MTSLFDDEPASGIRGKPSPAETAYRDMEVRGHAERAVRAAGRSASPEFLKLIGYAIIEMANAKGGRS